MTRRPAIPAPLLTAAAPAVCSLHHWRKGGATQALQATGIPAWAGVSVTLLPLLIFLAFRLG